MIAILTFFRANKPSDGARWVASSAEALERSGCEIRQFSAVMEGARFTEGGQLPYDHARVRKDWNQSNALAEICKASVIWIHQYTDTPLVFDILCNVDANAIIFLTNHSTESTDFFARYRKGRTHHFVEISKYSSLLTNRRVHGSDHLYGGVWKKNIVAPALPLSHRAHFSTVGEFLPHKGFKTPIEALAPHEKLILIGENYDDYHYSRLQALSANKHIEFALNIPEQEKKSRISTSRAQIVPSTMLTLSGEINETSELFSLAILEAVMLGTLPIASNIPPFMEIMSLLELQDHVFQDGDSSSLRRSLSSLQSISDGEYQSMIQNAQNRLREHFLWDDFAGRFTSLLTGVSP